SVVVARPEGRVAQARKELVGRGARGVLLRDRPARRRELAETSAPLAPRDVDGPLVAARDFLVELVESLKLSVELRAFRVEEASGSAEQARLGRESARCIEAR